MIEQQLEKLHTEVETKMGKSLTFFQNLLTGFRTGRAHPSLLDNIKVDAYGNFIPLTQVANTSAIDSKTLLVQVWDKNLVHPIEKSIRSSDLNLNPIVEGNVLRIPLPEMTGEGRIKLCKQIDKNCEEAKITIRQIRQWFLNEIKQFKPKLPEDVEKSQHTKIQKITDHYTAQISQLASKKQNDIMTV
jgi:ribosome recycling factor